MADPKQIDATAYYDRLVQIVTGEEYRPAETPDERRSSEALRAIFDRLLWLNDRDRQFLKRHLEGDGRT